MIYLRASTTNDGQYMYHILSRSDGTGIVCRSAAKRFGVRHVLACIERHSELAYKHLRS
jgi:hypothetical protein